MSIKVVVGANWGDEGKGRMVDYLAQKADVVVRYQGGNNAGHTVINEFGTFKLNLIPAGIFNPAVTNILGPGMVIDLAWLDKELTALKDHGIAPLNIKISNRATIAFPFHQKEDAWEDVRLENDGQTPFGSTKKGIAPSYGDRYLKKGIQVGDILYPERLRERLQQIVAWKNLIAQGVYSQEEAISFEEMMDWVTIFGDRIKDMIGDTTPYLTSAAQAGKTILFEAQLGALRDIHFGIYPYTSSSCCLAAFTPIGGGLFGARPDYVLGVMKAFSTCVGEGPFVTEMVEEAAKAMRELAGEYGAATGRPRRIGHFDAFASQYGLQIQGADDVALTKLDCLTGLDPLLICTGYEYNGKRLEQFPLNPVLEACRPVYKEMAGWSEDISAVRHFADLPEAAQAYVHEIERLVARPIRYISVGAERACLIDRG